MVVECDQAQQPLMTEEKIPKKLKAKKREGETERAKSHCSPVVLLTSLN